MAYPVGYQSLLARILRVGNVENKPRYVEGDNPTLVMGFINDALTHLDDELASSIQDYKVETTPLTVETGDVSTLLPDLFLKLRRLYFTEGGELHEVEPFMLAEQTMITNASVVAGGTSRIRYNIFGNVIRWAPLPTRDYAMMMEYVRTTPQFTDPSADESLNFIHGWDRWVVNEIGAMILEMEGLDGSSIQAKADKALTGIKNAAMDRNQADPEYMVLLPNDRYYYRSRQ